MSLGCPVGASGARLAAYAARQLAHRGTAARRFITLAAARMSIPSRGLTGGRAP
ncbi:hypothetical protein ABZX74_28875 [Streptomyces olivaceoviridis]|uniref:hypothetical protein n=1 Tax=Streptomyces olivaceoviridis TaxID=1921 RepID=UPI0033A58416